VGVVLWVISITALAIGLACLLCGWLIDERLRKIEDAIDVQRRGPLWSERMEELELKLRLLEMNMRVMKRGLKR
jgi:hypothetical protein